MNKVKLLWPCLVLAVLTACSALPPGSDPLVVRAEQGVAVAFATLDTFVKLDHANRELYKSKFPDVHKFAEYVREPIGSPPVARGIGWIESALAAKDAYKRNRSPENKMTLVSSLATLETFVRETQRHLDTTKP